ncbi:unnamed protein product [Knipowitschia caucasica]
MSLSRCLSAPARVHNVYCSNDSACTTYAVVTRAAEAPTSPRCAPTALLLYRPRLSCRGGNEEPQILEP